MRELSNHLLSAGRGGCQSALRRQPKRRRRHFRFCHKTRCLYSRFWPKQVKEEKENVNPLAYLKKYTLISLKKWYAKQMECVVSLSFFFSALFKQSSSIYFPASSYSSWHIHPFPKTISSSTRHPRWHRSGFSSCLVLSFFFIFVFFFFSNKNMSSYRVDYRSSRVFINRPFCYTYAFSGWISMQSSTLLSDHVGDTQ